MPACALLSSVAEQLCVSVRVTMLCIEMSSWMTSVLHTEVNTYLYTRIKPRIRIYVFLYACVQTRCMLLY